MTILLVIIESDQRLSDGGLRILVVVDPWVFWSRGHIRADICSPQPPGILDVHVGCPDDFLHNIDISRFAISASHPFLSPARSTRRPGPILCSLQNRWIPLQDLLFQTILNSSKIRTRVHCPCSVPTPQPPGVSSRLSRRD